MCVGALPGSLRRMRAGGGWGAPSSTPQSTAATELAAVRLVITAAVQLVHAVAVRSDMVVAVRWWQYGQ